MENPWWPNHLLVPSANAAQIIFCTPHFQAQYLGGDAAPALPHRPIAFYEPLSASSERFESCHYCPSTAPSSECRCAGYPALGASLVVCGQHRGTESGGCAR